MAIIRRIVQHPDGREEVFVPYKDQHNRYVMATKQTDDPIQYATNQVLVDTEEEVIRNLRAGGYSLRMTTGERNAPANLIVASNIENIE